MKWGHQVPQNSLLLRDAESKVKPPVSFSFLVFSGLFHYALNISNLMLMMVVTGDNDQLLQQKDSLGFLI